MTTELMHSAKRKESRKSFTKARYVGGYLAIKDLIMMEFMSGIVPLSALVRSRRTVARINTIQIEMPWVNTPMMPYLKKRKNSFIRKLK